MGMKKVNLNSVYVVDSPKKNILLMVILEPGDLKAPLQDQWIRRLDDLSKTCDILFMFPSGSYKIIDCDKFSNLLMGKAWIAGDWRKTIPEVFGYSLEVFNIHSYHIIFNLKDVMDLERDQILNLAMKNVKGPIFKVWRKKADDLYQYYREIPVGKELWYKLPLFFKKNSLDKSNYHSRWTTKSKFIWLGKEGIKKFLDYSKEGIIDTFESIGDFFGSGIYSLDFPTFLNRDMEELNGTGLDTERKKQELPPEN
jgi:hypothetical protein